MTKLYAHEERFKQMQDLAPELVEALRDIVQQSRVGSGGRPVCRSRRVNYPASLYQNARALLAKIDGGQA